MDEQSGTGDLWGGRFRSPLHPGIRAFTGSLEFDRRVARHDLVASMAHARTLREAGVLDAADADAVLRGLAGMAEELERGELAVEGEDEDVHGWIERTLTDRIGEPAARLHAGRSRNDQTGAALRLFVRESLEGLVERAVRLARSWARRADEHTGTVMPGYTHLQRAQPVTLGHHLAAHAWAVAADARRFRSAHASAGRSPLGSAALAGTSLAVDPGRTAELLGFDGPYPNSLHAVGDRDYVAEAVFACALAGIHLSRWAEEVVLWTTEEFGFARLDDEVAQGSSIMPQKKNPEAAELVRGKSGRGVGDLVALMTMMKGLPLAYNSDLQEDKEPLFDALDTASGTLEAAALLSDGLAFDVGRLGEAAQGGHATATDLAEALVRRGVPFRRAHERVGRAVLAAEERGCRLWELPAEELERCCPELEPDDREALRPDRSVRSRSHVGGPAPAAVERQLASLRQELDGLERWLEGRAAPPVELARRAGTLTDDTLSW